MIDDPELVLWLHRTRTALSQAPELVAHMRSLMLPSDGRTERGVEQPIQRTPLLTGVVDDADTVYVSLLEWARYWFLEFRETRAPFARARAVTDLDSPVSAPEVKVLGFHSGTTPEGARFLTGSVAGWLSGRLERIAESGPSRVFFEDVVSSVWGLRARHGLTRFRERPVTPRRCPDCGEAAVGAVWTSDKVTDVIVGCQMCGWFLPAPTPGQVVSWLDLSARVLRVSVACEVGEHDGCRSVGCECDCSHGATVGKVE